MEKQTTREHVDEKVQMAIEDAVYRALEADWSVEKIREEVNYVIQNAG
jgi:ribosome-associated toxin RatA of RatAB toxin-antitoxin module